MQKNNEHINKKQFPVKTTVVMLVLLMITSIALLSFKKENRITHNNNVVINRDSIASVKAFTEVYKVLMSPRCMNCHPSGDAPLQGDDSHMHTMNIQR